MRYVHNGTRSFGDPQTRRRTGSGHRRDVHDSHRYDCPLPIAPACAQNLYGALLPFPAGADFLQLVKEAQALHVRSEMAALATEAKSLMDVDPWLAPEPPHPPGGTRLPHLFGALAHERMLDLVRRDCVHQIQWISSNTADAIKCSRQNRY